MSALRWVTRGRADVLEALWPRIHAACERGATLGEMVAVEGRRGYLKASALRGKASVRHALRARLGLLLPRLQEFENLAWLRDNGFRAPRPLAAAGAFRLGRPVYQFLLTEEVPEAPTLRQVFEGRPTESREAILKALGRTLARLHASGFVHRDAFPRNLLVETNEQNVSIVFLDAWRGGARRGWRGPTYDLACLLLFAPDLFSDEEQATLLTAYFEDAPPAIRADPAAALAAAGRQRRALALRFARRSRAGAGAAPSSAWEPPRSWAAPGNLKDGVS